MSTKDKNILVAIYGSESSKKTVQYIADLLNGISRYRFILVSFIPLAETENILSKTFYMIRDMSARIGVLFSYGKILMDRGFSWRKIKLKLMPLNGSLAKCIIKEQHKNNCSTIVVGRRGISRKEEFLYGSTSSDLLHIPKNCSVWVVG